MANLEKQFQRLPGLEKWFVEIGAKPGSLSDNFFLGLL
jgi:hypothetical protein